jgi:hypothetical protein
VSDAVVEHEPTAADFLQKILDRPATVNWKQWRDAQEALREKCPCRVHTYQRWAYLTQRPPDVNTASKQVLQERRNILSERQKFAFEVGLLFDLIPEENWPVCLDQGEAS